MDGTTTRAGWTGVGDLDAGTAAGRAYLARLSGNPAWADPDDGDDDTDLWQDDGDPVTEVKA